MKRISIPIENLKNIITDILIRCKEGYLTTKEIDLDLIFSKNHYNNKGTIYKTILNYLSDTGYLKKITTSIGVSYKTEVFIKDTEALASKYYDWVTVFRYNYKTDKKVPVAKSIVKLLQIGDPVYRLKDNQIVEYKVIGIEQKATIDKDSYIMDTVKVSYCIYNRNLNEVITDHKDIFRTIEEVITKLKGNIIHYDE